MEKAEKRIKDLEEKLGKNSSNSSIPPSANPPGSKKPVVKKSTGPEARWPAGSAIPASLPIPAEPVVGCHPSLSQGLPRVRGLAAVVNWRSGRVWFCCKKAGC